MHLSENIQQLRRQAGMSQEALAEKLGVSRQAVSKWESGAATPELEKLTDMAALFSVRLDELLGLPSPGDSAFSSTAQEDEARRAEYDESLRHALAASSAQTAAHYKNLMRTTGLILVGVLAAAFLLFTSQFKSLRQEYSNDILHLQSSISNLQSQLYALQTPQEETSDALLSHQYTVTAFDPLKGVFSLLLSATPREYQEGTVARFVLTAEDFAPIAAEAVRGVDGALTAEVELPLSDYIELKLVLSQDGVERTEPVDTLSGWKSECLLTLQDSSDVNYSHFSGSSTVRFDLTPRAEITAGSTDLFLKFGLLPLAPVSGHADIIKNGDVLKSVPLTFTDQLTLEDGDSASTPAVTSAYGPAYAYTATGEAMQFSCDFVPGDYFSATLSVTDSYGIQYEITFLNFSIDEHGKFS